MHVISMRSTLTTPARARGLPRDHETPGLRGSRMENSWDHSQAPLMNIQTQIDLFPVGMSYYSQILISLQIPPVPPAFPTCSSSGQDPGSRETGDRTWGTQGPRVCSAKARPRLTQQDACWAGRESQELFIFEPVAAANRAPLSCPGQFTAWYCSSGRGGGNGPCHTWEGKTNMFPTLTKPTTGLGRE